MKAAVEMDMYGCPNRCKHCWIGHPRSANVAIDDFLWVAEQFKEHRKDGKRMFDELIFSTWFREPDFDNRYKELYDLENHLGDIPYNRGERELASIWRLVRDPQYAPWLKTVGVNCVQISFFGMEQNTDYYTGRKGAFKDCMKAIDVLFDAGIAPRIQMFPLKTNLGDFELLIGVLRDIQLEERVRDLGREFVCFLNAVVDPMGEGFNLENIRINRNELLRLPSYFLEKTLKHFKAENIEKLWPSESDLSLLLLGDDKPLNDNPPVVSFMVLSDFNVYPNCGEIAKWWCLGNLKNGGVDAVIDTFLEHGNLGLKLNYETPIKYLAAKYGDSNSDRLYTRIDLGHRWIRLEGIQASKFKG